MNLDRQSPEGLPAPQPRPGFANCPVVLLITAGSCVVWLVWIRDMPAWDSPLARWMVLKSGDWRASAVFLHPFFHDHILHLAGSLAALIVAGRALESQWGSLRFGFFYVFVAALSAVVAMLIEVLAGTTARSETQLLYFGGGAPALASLAVFSWVGDPEEGVFRFVSRRHLIWAVILLGGTGLMLIDPDYAGYRVELLPQVSGLLFGLVSVLLIPVVDRQLLRLELRRRRNEEERVTRIRQRVDLLLDKISTAGIDSLSPEERSFLRHASKHFKRP